MPNLATKGRVLAGGIRLGSQGRAINISPVTSAVTANSTEERSYTTGLADLGLVANDAIIMAPNTVLASGLVLAGARVQSANTLHVLWSNPTGSDSTGFATHYTVIAI